LVFWQPREFGQLPPHERPQDRRRDLACKRTRRGDKGGAALRRRRPVPRGEFLEQKLRQRRCAFDRALERRLAVRAHEVVRILAVGEEQEARLLAVGQHRQRVFERAPRGFAPCSVAVEAEDHPLRQAKELLRMKRCRGGAQRRHRVLDAVLGERHDIHVALDHEHLTGGAYGISRKIETVELFSLGEESSFR
jgi:hypothetical protein